MGGWVGGWVGGKIKISFSEQLGNGPATAKLLRYKVDQKSGPSGPDFARKSAHKLAGEVTQATFPANLWADFRAKSDPGEPLV